MKSIEIIVEKECINAAGYTFYYVLRPMLTHTGFSILLLQLDRLSMSHIFQFYKKA